MWSFHWSPLTQTNLLLSPSDGLASFLETTLANGVKVVENVITSKFRFHLIAIYALGCFCNFSCIPVTVPKLPWRDLTPVRLVKEWILMLLIKKTINLKTVGPVTLIFYWPKAVSGTDVCLSCIRFPLNNLSLPQVNYLKSIHKIRDHIKQDKFDFVLQKLFQL